MRSNTDKPQTKIYDFDKIWRFFPLSRPKKELLKYLLFSIFPFFFSDWAVYLNWKNARIFRPKQKRTFLSSFWKDHYTKKISFNPSIPINGLSAGNESLAVIIHVFYTDIFDEILTLLKRSDCKAIKLYLTTIPELRDTVKEMAALSPFRFSLLVVNNRGRDVLPFLKILPEVMRDGNEIILKIHTKKSNHLKRKELWNNDLLEKLIGREQLNKNVQILQNNKSIGMIGPSGHILPMMFYYGANAASVVSISEKMGVSKEKLAGLCFAAGSMFFARKESLILVMDLPLSDDDFEKENDQKDGTLAHSLERVFAVALIAGNLEMVDTEYYPANPSVKITNNHYFSV